MSIQLVYHLQDSRYVGILPSMMEALSELSRTMGVDEVWVVDLTEDGVFNLPNHVPHHRVRSLADVPMTDHVIAVETPNVKLEAPLYVLDNCIHPPDYATYVFGPHNGLRKFDVPGMLDHCYLDYGGHIDVRDAITLVLDHRRRTL